MDSSVRSNYFISWGEIQLNEPLELRLVEYMPMVQY